MSRPRVKFCGITRREDALAAARLGADAVGFVFWARSPRAIAVETAAGIAAALPPFVARVGVFVDEPPARVAEVVAAVGLSAVQLHGDEDAAAYRRIPASLIKAVTLGDDGALARAAALPADVTPLVDADDREARGGTGRLGDWTRAARLAAGRPILLAGGLTPANVGRALREVRPWGVDVSSGVERAPGVKDEDAMRRFVQAVTAAGPEAAS